MSIGRSREDNISDPIRCDPTNSDKAQGDAKSGVSLEKRAGTHLNTLPSSQAAQNLLKQLPVNSVRMVKVELALERGVELGLVMTSVERILGEDHDVGDVVQAREDLFGDRCLFGWVIKGTYSGQLSYPL